jgi:type I restriction enzyme S subunit
VVAGQHILASQYNLNGDGFPYLTGPADFGPKAPIVRRWTHSPKSTALPGDILLTVKGAGVGKINLAPDFEVAIGRQIMAIRPNPTRILQDYLCFFLNRRFRYFQSIATKTTVPGFKKSDVERLEIPLPDLSKQRDIVAYLDSLKEKLDELRELQNATQREMEELVPSILGSLSGE